MRLIDADKLHYSRIRIAHSDGIIGGYNAVVMSAEIKDAPTVDAVPVVRCKDCKFGTNDHSGFVVCRMASYPNYTARNQNWYCADGERKGGDENEEPV